MEKVLYITANPKQEEKSYSLTAGREFLNQYKKINPKDEIVEIDLYDTDLTFIDADVFNGWEKLQSGESFETLSDVEKSRVGKIDQYTKQFMDTDKYIFVSPLWNLSIPPKLKAYIDKVAIANKTFKYTEKGPVGLLKNKKAIHIQASGGFYSEGPAKASEFGHNYMRTILGFMGIEAVESILIEGTAMTEQNTASKAKESVDGRVRGF